jgi:hypothetical protein
MSIATKIATASLAALTMGAVLANSSQAQARGWGLGLGLGLAAGAVVGAAAASSYAYGPAYVVTPGYRPCHWVRQFDGYGNYVGRTCI